MIPIPGRLALRLLAGIGCALLLALLVHDRNCWKAKAAQFSQQIAAERAANVATVANYRAAAERARREDAENLARVRAEQAAINEGSMNDFESRIAAVRARSGELRGKAGSAAADSGGRGSSPVPAISVSTGSVAEAAGEDRLPGADRLIATEQAIQLDELIKWVRRQAAVPQATVNP